MFFKKEKESLVDSPIKFGDMFYSKYFNSNGIVVAVTDKEWFFVLERGLYAGVVQKAQAKTSQVEWIRRG